jgi:cytochrome P450
MLKSQIAAKTDPSTYVITEEDLLSQFITFFFAGMDTTGHLIGMAIYQLAKNPEYLDRLMKELEENVKEDGDYEAHKLNQCLFFSAFLKECLRMYPPAPQPFPRVANHDHMIGEFKIKKGTCCTAPFTAIQNNPKYYKDP